MILIEPHDSADALVTAAHVNTPVARKLFERQVEACGGRLEGDLMLLPLPRVPTFCARMEAQRQRYEITGIELEEPNADLVERALARANEAMARMPAELALRPYQFVGIRALAQGGALGLDSFLLSDDMGLGKTAQALLAIDERTGTIWVCPASLKFMVVKQARLWRPDLKVTVLSGARSFRWPEPGEIVVLNYELLPGDVDRTVKRKRIDYRAVKNIPAPNPTQDYTLIADEAHYLTSAGALRTLRFRALRNVATFSGLNRLRSWALTGTEFKNHPGELWVLLTTFGLEHVFESYPTFVFMLGGLARGANASRTQWPDVVKPTHDFIEKLQRVSLKRLKEDHLKIPLVMTAIPVDVSDKGVIDQCDEVLAFMRERGIDIMTVDSILKEIERTGMVGMSLLAKAMAGLAQAKMTAALEVIEAHEAQDLPLVVFSANRHPIEMVGAREGWGVIHGGITSHEARERTVEAFQAGQLRGIAGTIGAMGVGHTLTRAAHVLRINLAWTPADNSQAIDRLRRFGQLKTVVASDLVANHLLDERVYATTVRKQGYLDATVLAAARRT